jgi:uncharacterized phiE125 gp8 family phage protein
MTRLTLISGPAVEPVNWAEARDFLKLSGTSEQTLVEMMIAAARQAVEELTGRVLILQQWEMRLDRWPSARTENCGRVYPMLPRGRQGVVMLQRAPVLSVESVEVVNSLGTFVAVAADDYVVDASHGGGRISAAPQVILPEPARDMDGIRIRFTAGYGSTPAHVPPALRQAILTLVSGWYEQRGMAVKKAFFPPMVAELLAPYKLFRV